MLDRLLDDAPDESQDPHRDWSQQIRDLKRSVGRDLEALLNTRSQAIELPEELEEAGRSLLTYGLPDFSALNLSVAGDRNRVRRALEKAIATFEPRLEQVRVHMDDPSAFDHGLRFRIEAVLRLDPTPEPVTFDAVLQPTTQEYEVRGQS